MAWTRKPEKVEAKGGVIAGNAKLQGVGITTALQFTEKPATFARGLLNKPGLLTWQELRGQDVIDITELPMKQSITTSRTFATAITEQSLLEEQIANFCAHRSEEHTSELQSRCEI